MSKLIHQVWVQGEASLPDKFQQNRSLWKKEFPDFTMVLWDEDTASRMWPDYAEVSERCHHHATRADLILARAVRDYGGLATGTDCTPNNVTSFRKFIDIADSMLVITPGRKEISNGLQWSSGTHHPFWECVCKHQLREGGRHLSNSDVPFATGPGCYMDAFRARKWDLFLVTATKAFTTDWAGTWRNPDAFIHAGYAASWMNK